MRILYHHRTLADGAEGIHIAEMVSAFRELGHDVRVVGLAAAAAPSQGRGIAARMRRALPEPVHELAGAACNALEYRQVGRAIDEYRPDLLYKRHARNDVAALSVARARRVPSALEVNCLYSDAAYRDFEPLLFRRMTAGFERRALTLASVVLAVSSPLAQAAAALAATAVHVLPNGANPVRFSPADLDPAEAKRRLGLPPGVTIGWVGIMRAWHGLDGLLDLLVRVPDATLLVVGDGPSRGEFQAGAAARGLAERIVVTGRVPHDAVPACLRAVDIAVVPDERTGIASPMKLLEYMAMGLAVVAPDVPNLRDVLESGLEGILVRPGSADELSAAVSRLAGDRELRQRMGAAARLKIERERNWRRNAERVLDLLSPGLRPQARAAQPLRSEHV